MNPITNIKNLNKINERELAMGYTGQSNKSWHQKYADSAWIFAGGLPYDLTEGDVISVFSQYGEIVNINLIRDHKTGKSKGFGFLCYEDQRSTILAVDNLNGIKLLGRMIRVDHVEEYKVPKYKEELDADTKKLWEEGCAPRPINVGQPSDGGDDDGGGSDKTPPPRNLDDVDLLPLKEEDLDPALKAKIKQERKKRKKEKKKKHKHDKDNGDDEERRKKHKKVKSEDDVDRDVQRSWKDQRKQMDVDRPRTSFVNDDEFYGSNDHFNFGGKKKDLPPPPTHNIRPDFEKADWRDIEIWKMEREREKAANAEATGKPKEEEHYLPTRFRR